MTTRAHAVGTFITQFERVYGSAGTEGGAEVHQTADGGFIAIGGGPSSNTLVVKTDANGEPEWQYTYSAPSAALRCQSLVQVADGGYVIAGGITPSPRPGSGGSRDSVMIKLDADGVEQWRTIMGGNSDEFMYTLALADDGSVIGVGGTYSNDIPGWGPASYYAAYVARVAADGTFVEHRAYDQIGSTENYEEAYYIVKTPDGGYMIQGVNYSPLLWFLLRLDASLNRLWGQFYGSEYAQMVVNTPGGGVLTAGGQSGPPYQAVLYQLDPDPLDPDGPLVVRSGWPKYYVRDDYQIYDIFYYAEPTTDGGYIAGGYHVYLTDPENPATEAHRKWVVKLDGNGTVVREGLYAQAGLLQVHQTADGGYIATGQTTGFPGGPGGSDLYLLKLLEPVDPGVVEGSVWFDADATCSVNGEDVPVGGRTVRLVDNSSSAAFLAMSGQDGSYAATVPPADYTVTLVPNAIGTQPETCGPSGESYQVTVAAGTTSPDKNFNSSCTCQINQSLSSGPTPPIFNCPSGAPTTPCAGYPWKVCYKITNNCDNLHTSLPNVANPRWVRACINLPPEFEYLGGATTNVDSGNCANSGWIPDPTNTSINQVCFKHSTSFDWRTNCTSTLCAEVQPIAGYNGGGTVNAQFSASANQCSSPFPPAPPLAFGTTSCACDPNAKHVSPEGCGAGGSITPQELTYLVEFQNLGAGPAHDVVITDALDADLDLETLRIVDTSHTATNVQVDDNGNLVVTFTGIELPAAVADEPGSHGHVRFAITPKDGLADGTEIENTASIVFDTNEPVVTNTVHNTLYAGDPVPVVDFTATRNGQTFDFAYTGGTTGATFAWDFGPHAEPRTSIVTNPTGITFDGIDPQPVLLEATKAGCTAQAVKAVALPCEAFWTTTAFDPSLGKRVRRVTSRLKLKFKLSYNGEPVTTLARLDEILNTDFDRTPAGDCWPRVRVFRAGDEQELALGDEAFPGAGVNPDGCFKFRRDGVLSLNMKLVGDAFEPDTQYVARVQAYTCTLTPGANVITTKP